MRAFVDWMSNTPITMFIGQSGWIVPLVQTIHILCIAIIVSSILMIDLRIMGWAGKGQSLRSTINRFGPWFWGALITLAITGLTMIVAEPVRELLAISFWLKMLMLAIGVAIALVFLRNLDRNEARWEQSVAVPRQTRTLGLLTLLVWCAVIFLGRFIAYDPQIWGKLSPLF